VLKHVIPRVVLYLKLIEECHVTNKTHRVYCVVLNYVVYNRTISWLTTISIKACFKEIESKYKFILDSCTIHVLSIFRKDLLILDTIMESTHLKGLLQIK
jgi:hypothetical protein